MCKRNYSDDKASIGILTITAVSGPIVVLVRRVRLWHLRIFCVTAIRLTIVLAVTALVALVVAGLAENMSGNVSRVHFAYQISAHL
jgi:hypothetical protein